MRCPRCSVKDTKVIDSRITKNELSIRRRRQCEKCDYRFNTIEEVIRDDIVVIKRDGRRENFDRNKILSGIRKACEKRPIDLEQIDMLISDVMNAIQSEFDYEIPGQAIGENVMKRLKNIDHIAFVRFASVYKDFHDLSDLENEISRLKQK